jgi:Tfp pilus assembly protein PilW
MSTGMIARIRAVVASGDAGITLMELIVGMALSTILGAMTLMLFLDINSSAESTTDRTINTASVRNAIQSWTTYLRVADGTTAGDRSNRIEWLTPSDMLFYADINNRPDDTAEQVKTIGTPTMMWLRLDSAGNLVEEQFSSTATRGTVPSTCRVLAENVSTPSAPLFAPFDTRNRAMTGQDLGTAPGAAAGCQPLPVTVPSQTNNPDAAAQANLQNVRSVVIDAVVRDSRGAHPIEFTSQAVLPNVGGVG